MSERRRRPVPPYVRDAVVLGIAVGVFGASFGVVCAAAGLGVAKASVLSLAVFTGASQFAAVGVIAGGGTAAAAVGSALLLAARNAAYGVTVSPLLRHLPLAERLLAAQLVIDESTAMALAQEREEYARKAFFATGVSIYVCWNVATVLGAVAGSAIGDPAAYGLDVVFPASVVALLVPHLRHTPGRVAAAGGGAVAALLVPLTPAGVPVVAAAVAAVPAMLFRSPGGVLSAGTPASEART